MIGDGYAMGVATQILEHILGATERWLRIDHPVFVMNSGRNQAAKVLG